MSVGRFYGVFGYFTVNSVIMSGHTTILTGASRGIGAAIAKIFLSKSNSNKLVGVARSASELNKLVEEYGEDRVGVVIGDVSKKETSVQAVELAIEKFGSIDSIILNAGVLSPVEHIADANVEKWIELYQINFFSVVEMIKQALPHLKKTNGNIVAVSSGASTSVYDAWGAYGTSKAALNHLIKSVATEEKDINAISIAPGVVNTSMQTDIRETFGKNMDEDGLKKFIDLHKNDQLLPPEVPATIYANLAYKGWSKDINGQYLRYNDEELKEYLA